MTGKILVTGASGFVGRALVAELTTRGHAVRVAVRQPGLHWPEGVDVALPSQFGPEADWAHALHGIDAVVHCAARVHVMRDASADPLSEFRRVNVDGSLRLAAQAARAGTRRFVFISSIGVNGAETFDRPFRAGDAPAPHSPYAVSKLEAERALASVSCSTGMEVVVVRPPLVYGPHAPGNFGQLMRVLQRGWPLPLGAIHNRRSLVGLDNLVDLLIACVTHPGAAGQILLAGDGEDLSTTELLLRIAAALGRTARLVPLPASLLRFAGGLLGKSGVAQQLCGSLQVDIEDTRRLLQWSPPFNVTEELRRATRPLAAAAR